MPTVADQLAEYLDALDLIQSVAGELTPESWCAEPTDRRWSHGDILGEFRILREVGRGGMGVVYEAEQLWPPGAASGAQGPPRRSVARRAHPPALPRRDAGGRVPEPPEYRPRASPSASSGALRSTRCP